MFHIVIEIIEINKYIINNNIEYNIYLFLENNNIVVNNDNTIIQHYKNNMI